MTRMSAGNATPATACPVALAADPTQMRTHADAALFAGAREAL